MTKNRIWLATLCVACASAPAPAVSAASVSVDIDIAPPPPASKSSRRPVLAMSGHRGTGSGAATSTRGSAVAGFAISTGGTGSPNIGSRRAPMAHGTGSLGALRRSGDLAARAADTRAAASHSRWRGGFRPAVRAVPAAASRYARAQVSSARPVSRRDLRLDSTRGQPTAIAPAIGVVSSRSP